MDADSVVMTTPDNKLVTVPNKAVWGSAITNFSALETRRVDVAVGIAYGADIGQAKQVALDALAQIPEIIAEPAPMTEVSSLGESAVVLTVRGWCKNADYWTAYFAATRKVKEAFPEALLIFIAPPDAETLASRLSGRGTETPEQIAGRLRRAAEESRCMQYYDYLLINDDLDKAVERLHDLISVQHCRMELNSRTAEKLSSELTRYYS